MINTIQEARDALNRAKGRKETTERNYNHEKGETRFWRVEVDSCTKANLLLQEAAKRTHDQLVYRITQLVSLALAGVFDNPYTLELLFEAARGKTSAFLYFKKNGVEFDPMIECEGGAIDVATFGLRVALWSLQSHKTRNVLILDEPLKWVQGGDLPDRGAEMIQQIANKIGIQIIIVANEATRLEEYSDKVFKVKQINGVSEVRE